MTASVLISHSSLDNELTSHVLDWLNKAGFIDVFVDFAGIKAGDKWAQVLREHHASCRVVLCVVTPNWLNSDECIGEFLAASYNGKRIISLFAYDIRQLSAVQTSRLARVRSEDQGIDISSLVNGTKLKIEGTAEAERLVWSLRAAGALSNLGMDPHVFETDVAARPSPFPGLDSFGDTDADAAIFFGRTPEITLVTEDLRVLRASSQLTPYSLVGSSGSGKSSLLKAGILPRLRRESGWLVLPCVRPGRDPLLNLAEALSREFRKMGRATAPGELREEFTAAFAEKQSSQDKLFDVFAHTVHQLRLLSGQPTATILLSFDQAEELLDANGKEADIVCSLLRTAYARRVAGRSPIDLQILTSIRTDRVPALQRSARFEGLPFRYTDIRAVPLHRFGQAIEGPASRYGCRFEPELIDALVADAKSPEALPLLAFSVARLWGEFGGKGRSVDIQHYEKLGKISGLINDAAERALRLISPSEERAITVEPLAEHVRLVARMFVPKLSAIAENGSAIRRIAQSSHFTETEFIFINKFLEWRLLVHKGQPESAKSTVEVAHEVIFRAWRRAAGWIIDERSRLRSLTDLEGAARDYVANKRQPSFLAHRGSRLRNAIALAKDPLYEERVSKGARGYLGLCVRARRQRRLRMAVGAGAISLGFTTLFGVLHGMAGRTILQDISTNLVRGGYPAAALKFGVASAVERSYVSAMASEIDEHILRDTGYQTQALLDLPDPRTANRYAVTPDGKRLFTLSSDSKGIIWDVLASGRGEDRAIAKFEAESFELSPDGARLFTRSKDNRLSIWDTSTGHLLNSSDTRVYKSATWNWSVMRLVVLSEDGECSLWNLESGDLVGKIEASGFLNFCSIPSNGHRILTRTVNLVAELWDAADGKMVSRFPRVCYTCNMFPSANLILMIDSEGKGRFFDFQNGTEIMEIDNDVRLAGGAASSDGKRIIIRDASNQLTLWDTAPIRRMQGIGKADPDRYSFSPNGKQILIQGTDSSAVVRNSQDGSIIVSFGPGRAIEVLFSSGGDRLAVKAADKSGFLFEASTGVEIAELGRSGEIDSMHFSPNGTRLAIGSNVANGALWDSQTPRKMMDFFGPGADSGGEFSPDASRYLSLSRDNYAHVWDSEEGVHIAFLGGAGAVQGGSLVHRGRYVVTTSIDNTLVVRDYESAATKGKDLRGYVCDVNHASVGEFDRSASAIHGVSVQRSNWYLRGRPTNPCDWRGLRSIEGWLQEFRYWATALGFMKDYLCGQSTAFGPVRDPCRTHKPAQ